MKPKILFLQHRYFNRAGTEAHTKLLADGLKNYFSIAILAVEPNEIILVENNVVVSRWPVAALPFPETPIKDLQYEEILSEVIKKLTPDILHVHHLMNWPIAVCSQGIASTLPTVVTLHDYYFLTPEYTFQSGTLPISSTYQKERHYHFDLLLKRAAVIAPSEYVASFFAEQFSITSTVIEHGIASVVEDECVKQCNPAFGYLGSFLPQKGFDVLIRAYQQYRSKGGALPLKMYGGKLPFPVEGVTFYGSYDSSLLPTLFKEFCVGIVPSRFPETFCLTLSEQWALKNFVIGSDIGALSQRIKNSEAGIVVTPGDVLDLADAMLKVEQAKPWEYSKSIPVRSTLEMCEDYKRFYNDIYNRSNRPT